MTRALPPSMRTTMSQCDVKLLKAPEDVAV